ncbi:MAG: hypothetical protein U0795_01385 [Pirellulales bacterium]
MAITLRSGLILVAVMLFSQRIAKQQHDDAMLAEARQLAVMPDQAGFGDTLLSSKDTIASKYSVSLAGLNAKDIGNLLGDKSIPLNVRHLLLCSWIRVRRDVDELEMKAGIGANVLNWHRISAWSDSRTDIGDEPPRRAIWNDELGGGWFITFNETQDNQVFSLYVTPRQHLLYEPIGSSKEPRFGRIWWIPNGTSRLSSRPSLRMIERGWYEGNDGPAGREKTSSFEALIRESEVLAVERGEDEYGDKVLTRVDQLAAAYESELGDMDVEKLGTIVGDQTMSPAARFLVLCTWIRIRRDVDEALFESLAGADIVTRPIMPFASYSSDAGDVPSRFANNLAGPHGGGWELGLAPGPLDRPYQLVLTPRTNYGDPAVKAHSLLPRYGRTWWIIDTDVDHLGQLRMLERGWYHPIQTASNNAPPRAIDSPRP